MKRYYLLSAAMMLCVILSAQTQQGYVKTKGRMMNGKYVPGQGLKGATVSIKGRTTILVNKDDGSFSFPVPEAQFRVDSVRKQGYQLVDLDALSKTYKQSANPIYLVMETPEQQIEDRLDNYQRINNAQQQLISRLREEVKQLKKENRINEEEYGDRLQEIADMQIESQQLIDEMVERYSKIDYDQLSEFDRLISTYILNGELRKADSLLNTKGDFKDRAENLRKLNEANTKERKDLEKRKQNLEKSEALSIKERDDLANDYYHKFEILKLQHKNDSAAYYLELRVTLDTTNVEWLKETGNFIFDYLSDFDKSLYYFQKELKECKKQYGESSIQTSYVWSEIGSVFDSQRNFDSAIYYFKGALHLDSLNNYLNDFVISYDNLGLGYHHKGDYDNALDCFKKSLNSQNESYLIKANTYNNLGVMYKDMGDYKASIECIEKALEYWRQDYGDDYYLVGNAYNNLGVTYSELDSTELALEHYNKALQLWKNAFGEDNYSVALSYNNIGCIYRNLKQNDEALENLSKALNIWINILGEWNHAVAYAYKNIGDVYKNKNDYAKALEYYNKSLKIREDIYGHNYYLVAQSYYSIGVVYGYLKDSNNELENKEIALDIYSTVFGPNHPDVARVLNDLGVLYYKQGDYETASDYLTRALRIREEKFGKDSPRATNTRNNLEKVQAKLKEQENEQKTEK